MNRMLTDSGVELRLAESGDDIGRLVHIVDEARSDLLIQTPATATADVASRVDHAIALFRRRDSGHEDKRSAIPTFFLGSSRASRRVLGPRGVGCGFQSSAVGVACNDWPPGTPSTTRPLIENCESIAA